MKVKFSPNIVLLRCAILVCSSFSYSAYWLADYFTRCGECLRELERLASSSMFIWPRIISDVFNLFTAPFFASSWLPSGSSYRLDYFWLCLLLLFDRLAELFRDLLSSLIVWLSQVSTLTISLFKLFCLLAAATAVSMDESCLVLRFLRWLRTPSVIIWSS